jgi:ribonuclease R
LPKSAPPKASPKSSKPSAPLPSRDDILAFVASSPGKVGKREIAKRFRLGGGDRVWLKDTLKALEDEGALGRRGKRVAKAGGLPPVVLADIKGRDRDGELLAEPAEWNPEDGPAPKIVVAIPRKPKPGVPTPGVGDRALLRVARDGADERPTGRVIKILPKERNQVLGVFRALEGGGGRLVPVEKRSQGREVMIEPGDEGGALDGDLVSATLTPRGSRFGLPTARVKERLGSLSSEKAVSLIAIHAHAIPHVFSPQTLKEAEAARPATLAGREDWRDLPLLTIDPPDAKDHDDAVHAAPDPDPANPGGFVVTVAIADVAAYVRPGSAMDREALERGNSVYFPDRVVPMLPERSRTTCARCGPRKTARARRAHEPFRRQRPQAAPRLPPFRCALPPSLPTRRPRLPVDAARTEVTADPRLRPQARCGPPMLS